MKYAIFSSDNDIKNFAVDSYLIRYPLLSSWLLFEVGICGHIFLPLHKASQLAQSDSERPCHVPLLS